jgi:hypothetical protein
MFSIEHASIGAGCFAIKSALFLVVATEAGGAVKHHSRCAKIGKLCSFQTHIWILPMRDKDSPQAGFALGVMIFADCF